MADSNWNNVVFLWSADSLTLTDYSNSNHTVTLSTSPYIDNTIYKFGRASLKAGTTIGNAWYAEVADNLTDFNFGSGQFTAECWVRFTSTATSSRQTIFGQWTAATTNEGWVLRRDTTGLLQFGYSTTGTDPTYLTGSWSPSTDTWYHVAVDRDASNNIRVYVDGSVVIGPTSVPATFYASTLPLRISSYSGTANANFVGNIDEVRITKGVARYAGAFTPPSAAFEDDEGVIPLPPLEARITSLGTESWSVRDVPPRPIQAANITALGVEVWRSITGTEFEPPPPEGVVFDENSIETFDETGPNPPNTITLEGHTVDETNLLLVSIAGRSDSREEWQDIEDDWNQVPAGYGDTDPLPPSPPTVTWDGDQQLQMVGQNWIYLEGSESPIGSTNTFLYFYVFQNPREVTGDLTVAFTPGTFTKEYHITVSATNVLDGSADVVNVVTSTSEGYESMTSTGALSALVGVSTAWSGDAPFMTSQQADNEIIYDANQSASVYYNTGDDPETKTIGWISNDNFQSFLGIEIPFGTSTSLYGISSITTPTAFGAKPGVIRGGIGEFPIALETEGVAGAERGVRAYFIEPTVYTATGAKWAGGQIDWQGELEGQAKILGWIDVGYDEEQWAEVAEDTGVWIDVIYDRETWT